MIQKKNIVHDEGIVIKRFAFGEADWIVHLFTKDHGRLSAMAKSARRSVKRFGSSIELGQILQVSLSIPKNSERMSQLSSARPKYSMHGILSSYERIQAMLRAIELSQLFLQDHQSSKELYRLLELFLTGLCKYEPKISDILAFEYTWLKFCGFKPDLSACDHVMKNKEPFFLNCELGKINSMVTHTGYNIPVSQAAAAGLSALTTVSNSLGDRHYRLAEQVMSKYIEFVVGKPLKSVF